MERGLTRDAADLPAVELFVEPPAERRRFDIRARARELRDGAPALRILATPFLAHAAVDAGDLVRIGLEDVDRQPAGLREVLAASRQARPPILRREHQERIEWDRDQRE